MKSELPQFKRCCLCLPLRRGIIGWGYVKLTLNVIGFILISMMFAKVLHGHGSLRGIMLIVTVICTLIIMTDSAFSVLLIVAGHKKSPKLLKISYVYSIVWMILLLLFQVMMTFLAWEKSAIYLSFMPLKYVILELLVDLATPFVNFLVQIYLILLIRSELMKLRNQSLEMQFVNNAAEAEAHCIKVNVCTTDNGLDSCVKNKDNTSEHNIDVHCTENEKEIDTKDTNNEAMLKKLIK